MCGCRSSKSLNSSSLAAAEVREAISSRGLAAQTTTGGCKASTASKAARAATSSSSHAAKATTGGCKASTEDSKAVKSATTRPPGSPSKSTRGGKPLSTSTREGSTCGSSDSASGPDCLGGDDHCSTTTLANSCKSNCSSTCSCSCSGGQNRAGG